MKSKLSFDFTGKNIVVSGGLGLLGSEVCRELVKANANLLILDISEDVVQFAEGLKKSEQTVIGVNIDISKEENSEKIANYIKQSYGSKVDGIVNAVQFKSRSFFKDLLEYNLNDWENIFSANVYSIFLVFKGLYKYFNFNEGVSIVNFSSTYAIVSPNPIIYSGLEFGSPAAYSASKGAVHSLTKYLACYYASENIRVNSVTPHGVSNNHDEQFIENFSKLSPMKRLSKKEEVAPAIMFLLSDASSYITGSNYKIDGGWTAW